MSQSRPVIFGEVLFDCFEDGRKVLGGAPFNVAWNLQALGARPLFISRIGNDHAGELVATQMEAHGLDTSFLQIDTSKPTGHVSVILENGDADYDIKLGCAYDYIDQVDIPDSVNAGLLYHGTLALRNNKSRQTLNQIYQLLDLPVFLDVNLRFPWFEVKDINYLISRAKWCKLNIDESRELGIDILHDHKNIEFWTKHGKNLSTFYLTEGKSGATAFLKNSQTLNVHPGSLSQVVDTVGAGDAFCSILILGILKEWDMQLIMSRAQEFASAVVGLRGATTQNDSFYQTFIDRWKI